MNEKQGGQGLTNEQDRVLPLPSSSGPMVPNPLGFQATESAAAVEALERGLAAAMTAMDMPTEPLAAYDRPPPTTVVPGSEVPGTVVGVSDDDVFIDLGARSQGVLPLSQFGKGAVIEVGQSVAVVVDREDQASGLILCHRKGATQRASWSTLTVGMIVEGRVTGLIKGGLEVDVQGIRAFMPGSQASVTPMKDISVLLNERVRCEVIEVDKRGKNVIISRRHVLEKEQEAARKQLLAELAVGQTRRGTVKNITDFGAFVDLGGVEGLVHIRDLSWGTVGKVTDILSPGQEVEVKVLKIESKRGRISLGYKQAQPDPWKDAAERYPLNTEVRARVVRLADFGAFAEVEPGVEGLIPISEMGWSRVQRTSDVVNVGSVVSAVVIRVEPEKRRMALSMKRAQPDPWAGVLESFEVDSLVKGKVTRIADFGAFVEVAPGVEGLVHISEMSDRRVRTCADVVAVGQEVEARVLGLDQENRRIALSLKPRPEQAAAPAEPGGPDAKKVPPKKPRKKPLRGGLTSHFEW